MYGSGANIELPEAGEVLVCNSGTTAEDVSLIAMLITLLTYIPVHRCICVYINVLYARVCVCVCVLQWSCSSTNEWHIAVMLNS